MRLVPIAIALLSVSVTAVATEYGSKAYKPYYGDADGDGINDIYLHPVELVVPVDARVGSTYPVLAHPQLASLFIRGSGSNYDAPVAFPRLMDSEIVALGLQEGKYRYHSGDFDGDGVSDALLQGTVPELLSLTLRGTADLLPPEQPILQVLYPDPGNGLANLSGSSIKATVRDLDNDGDSDVLIAGFPQYAMLSEAGILGNYQQWDDVVDVKVMTFNVRTPSADLEIHDNTMWDSRSGQILSVISNHSPDIIGFQELYGGDLPQDFLEEQYFSQYSKCSTGSPAGEKPMPITFKASRFEILDCELYGSDSPKSYSVATVRYRGSPRIYMVANLHAPVKNCTDQGFEQVCNTIHSNYLAEVSNTIKASGGDSGHVRLIVLGDINVDWDDSYGYPTRPDGVLAELMAPLGLYDPYHVLNPGVDDSFDYTYRGKDRLIDGTDPVTGRRIDHVLFNDLLEPVSIESVRYAESQRHASDHYPVVATLRSYFRVSAN